MTVNGNDGERAYTLEKLRQEEQLLGGHARDNEFDDKGSRASSTYDLVEEMYENMNDFDQKLKVRSQVSAQQHRMFKQPVPPRK